MNNRIKKIFSRYNRLHTEIYLAQDDLYHLDHKLCKLYLIRKRLRKEIDDYCFITTL